MKIMIIGGTGTISMEVSRYLLSLGHRVYLINRGHRNNELTGADFIVGDINNEEEIGGLIKGLTFDSVIDFISYVPEQVQRNYRLFNDKTGQYIFISSATVYLADKGYIITEDSPLGNPYYEYARKKIACEMYLKEKWEKEAFPVTIIRPSHTYDTRSIPLGIHGQYGNWQNIKRMLKEEKVIIHGDGSSLWTMTKSSDFALGLAGLVGNTKALGEAFHITLEESMTWNEIYGLVAEELGVELQAVHIGSEFLACAGKRYNLEEKLLGDKARTVVFDNSKLKRLVPEYTPRFNMADGIRDTIQSVLLHPEYQIEDSEYDLWCDKVIGLYENALPKDII